MLAVLLLSVLVSSSVAGTQDSDRFEAQIERIIDLIGRSDIPQPEKECVKADIAFVLDVSSSVPSDDVDKMKAFVKKLINGFEVAQDKVRVAVVSFNRNFRIDLYLDQCKGPTDAIGAVENIMDTRTGTLTHKALDAVRTMVFVPSVGDRPDAPNIVVVITDGRSGNEEKTKMAALKLKATGAVVFSIGIGRWVSDAELQVIANKPATKFSKLLDNFDELKDIQDQFESQTCQTIIKPPKPMPECNPPLFDIAFILDASTSISEADFLKMKEFVVIFMSSFEISPTATRFAVILFSAVAKVDFDFDDYGSFTPMKEGVAKLKKLRTGTFTNKALDLARTEVFQVPREEGPPAKKITIVITDGRSRKRDETEKAATKLKATGVEIMAVGVGNFNKEELHHIASSPEDVFGVDNFENLKSLLLDMIKVTCKDVKENPEIIKPMPEPQKLLKECDGIADILFLVEIPKMDEDFVVVKKFLRDTIGRLVLSADGLRVAVTLYAKKTFPTVTFGDLADSSDIDQALQDFELPSNRDTSFKKVTHLFDHMADMGWRGEGVRKILVTMFIDNPSEGIKPALLKTYAEMKKRSFGSVVINLGVPWEEGSLMLASNPKFLNAIFVPRFDALKNVVDPTVTQICDVMDKDK